MNRRDFFLTVLGGAAAGAIAPHTAKATARCALRVNPRCRQLIADLEGVSLVMAGGYIRADQPVVLRPDGTVVEAWTP